MRLLLLLRTKLSSESQISMMDHAPEGRAAKACWNTPCMELAGQPCGGTDHMKRLP